MNKLQGVRETTVYTEKAVIDLAVKNAAEQYAGTASMSEISSLAPAVAGSVLLLF